MNASNVIPSTTFLLKINESKIIQIVLTHSFLNIYLSTLINPKGIKASL